MKTWLNIYNYAVEQKIADKSAIDEPAFVDFLEKIDTEIAVEIGTYFGLTAAYLATKAKSVITFDIKDHPHKYPLWDDAGVRERIIFVRNETIDDIGKYLAGKKFDFAFIDGPDKMELIEEAFNIVKGCGRVLFHNARRCAKFAEMNKFMDESLKGDYVEIGKQTIYWQERK